MNRDIIAFTKYKFNVYGKKDIRSGRDSAVVGIVGKSKSLDFPTMLIFWSLVRNSVVLAVYLLFSVACFLTVHEHFKKVLSKAKFWQMIGRGTRLCEGLIDGKDKDKFYIFDFCNNFEFFRLNKGKATPNMLPLQGAIFNLEFEICYKLQSLEYQQERLMKYRDGLVSMMTDKVKELPRDNFAVKQHLKYVDLYANSDNYKTLTYEDTLIVREELCPLIQPDGDEVSAVRFDALMYGIELAYLVGKKYTKARSDLLKKVRGIADVANIPEVAAKASLIDKILHTSYLESADKPDMTRVTIKLTNVHKDYESTLSASAGDSELLRSELEKLNFEKDELKTLSFGVDTETKSYRDKNDNWREKFIGYRYTHVMKIEFPSDNKRLGQILYMLAHEETLHPKFQFSFFVKDVEASKNELLGRAVTDAKAKAEVLTSVAGVKLLDILSIDYSWGEIDFEISPMRGDLGYEEYKMALAEPAGYDIDIESDDIEVNDTVTVVWGIG